MGHEDSSLFVHHLVLSSLGAHFILNISSKDHLAIKPFFNKFLVFKKVEKCLKIHMPHGKILAYILGPLISFK